MTTPSEREYNRLKEVFKYLESKKIFSITEKLPEKQGCYLVYAPKSFPKNSRWLVAEFYEDNNTFYSESSDYAIEDVTHWTKLPPEPF